MVKPITYKDVSDKLLPVLQQEYVTSFFSTLRDLNDSKTDKTKTHSLLDNSVKEGEISPKITSLYGKVAHSVAKKKYEFFPMGDFILSKNPPVSFADINGYLDLQDHSHISYEKFKGLVHKYKDNLASEIADKELHHNVLTDIIDGIKSSYDLMSDKNKKKLHRKLGLYDEDDGKELSEYLKPLKTQMKLSWLDSFSKVINKFIVKKQVPGLLVDVIPQDKLSEISVSIKSELEPFISNFISDLDEFGPLTQKYKDQSKMFFDDFKHHLENHPQDFTKNYARIGAEFTQFFQSIFGDYKPITSESIKKSHLRKQLTDLKEKQKMAKNLGMPLNPSLKLDDYSPELIDIDKTIDDLDLNLISDDILENPISPINFLDPSLSKNNPILDAGLLSPNFNPLSNKISPLESGFAPKLDMNNYQQFDIDDLNSI